MKIIPARIRAHWQTSVAGLVTFVGGVMKIILTLTLHWWDSPVSHCFRQMSGPHQRLWVLWSDLLVYAGIAAIGLLAADGKLSEPKGPQS